MSEWLLPFLAAAATGVLSSWGVGGGTLLLVCMTLFLGVDHREAQAINLLFFLPTAGISLFFHRKNGFLDKTAWRQAAIPGTIASLAGALAALTVDVSLLRKPVPALQRGVHAAERKKRPAGKSYKRGVKKSFPKKAAAVSFLRQPLLICDRMKLL